MSTILYYRKVEIAKSAKPNARVLNTVKITRFARFPRGGIFQALRIDGG